MLFLALSALAAWLLRREVSLPLRRLGQAMGRVAAADFTSAVPDCSRKDEIGALARDLDQLRLALGHADQVAQAAAAEKQVQSQVVERLRGVLERLSQGDLGTRIDEAFPPDYEALRSDVNALARTCPRRCRRCRGRPSASATTPTG